MKLSFRRIGMTSFKTGNFKILFTNTSKTSAEHSDTVVTNPYIECIMLNGAPKNGQGGESLESYRLTDLHQPTTINLFGTPVPKWPQTIFAKSRYIGEDNEERDSEGASTSADLGRVSESTVQEVLKLLEGVELSFMCVKYFLNISVCLHWTIVYS